MYIKISENSFRERRFFKSFPFPCSRSRKNIFVPVPVFPVPKSPREFPFPIPAGNGTGKYGKKSFPQDSTVHSYFIYDLKYFYICMIPGFSSFEQYINGFSSPMFDREISGLRSWTTSVVIRSTFPNFDSKPFFVPNFDTYTKFKRNPIFEIKQVFYAFSSENEQRSLERFCRACQDLS